MSNIRLTYDSEYGYEQKRILAKQRSEEIKVVEESEAKAEVKRLRAVLERISKSPDDDPDHLRWLAKDAIKDEK